MSFAVSYCEKLDVRIVWLITGDGGPDRVDGISALKSLLMKIDRQAQYTGDSLPLDAMADIASRLMQKQEVGLPVTDLDLKDDIELKRDVLRKTPKSCLGLLA